MSESAGADAALLFERMQSLGPSSGNVEPGVMRELQRQCSLCALKARCGHDLASARTAAAVADYCPNEATLKEML